jgi:hypothetical protein
MITRLREAFTQWRSENLLIELQAGKNQINKPKENKFCHDMFSNWVKFEPWRRTCLFVPAKSETFLRSSSDPIIESDGCGGDFWIRSRQSWSDSAYAIKESLSLKFPSLFMRAKSIGCWRKLWTWPPKSNWLWTMTKVKFVAGIRTTWHCLEHSFVYASSEFQGNLESCQFCENRNLQFLIRVMIQKKRFLSMRITANAILSSSMCFCVVYPDTQYPRNINQSTVVHLITGRHLIAGTPPNLTQVKIWEYLKMETLIEHD